VPTLTRRRPVRAGVLAALCLFAPLAEAASSRTDVVTMSNGDRMTGDIEKLDEGILELKTDHVGTLEFEWPSIEGVESVQSFAVTLDDGRRLFGSLRPAPGRRLDVVGARTERVDLRSVVQIVPLDRSFWEQLDGSMSVGVSFSQSNNTTTWTASADVEYLTRRYLAAVSASSYLNAQEGADTTTRNVVGLTLGRLFVSRWRLLELNELFQSDQLGIRLRTTLGGAVDHAVIHTNRNLLSPALGVAYSNTTFDGGAPARNEILALTGFQYAFFTFGQHKTTMSTSAYVLPSLSDWGHVRLDLNARLRVKLFRDFYWSVDVYENYDNDPPPGGAENDSGGSASLAWTF
jgi:hypothetical protein